MSEANNNAALSGGSGFLCKAPEALSKQGEKKNHISLSCIESRLFEVKNNKVLMV